MMILENGLDRILKTIENVESNKITRSSVKRLSEVIKDFMEEYDDASNADIFRRRLESIKNCEFDFIKENGRILFDSFVHGIFNNDTIFICDDCEEVEYLEGSSSVDSVGNVCESCLESGEYVYDDKNHEYILEEDSIRVSESTFGRNAYYTIHKDSVHEYAFFCNGCENHYDNNRVAYYEHVNGSTICERCSENYYFHEDGYLHDESEEDDQDEKGLLSNTNDDWTITPNRKNQNDKFLGIEIETYIGSESILENLLDDSINRNGTSKSDLENGQNFYCLKEDGSLDKNHGVEIVFHHDCPKNLKRNLKTFFEKNPRGISAWDKGSGYGIHIHLEKSSLSIEQRERILSFFLWSPNHNFLKFIARRSPNSYWSFDYFENVPPENGYSIKKHAKNLIEKGTEKYRAVYSNKKTLEFRMFRSTTKLESILVYVDFVLCLASFCKRSDSLDYNDFINFAISKRKHFENLATLLEKKFRNTGEN